MYVWCTTATQQQQQFASMQPTSPRRDALTSDTDSPKPSEPNPCNTQINSARRTDGGALIPDVGLDTINRAMIPPHRGGGLFV